MARIEIDLRYTGTKIRRECDGQLELPFGELVATCASPPPVSHDHNTLARAEYDAEQLWRAGLRLSRSLRDR